MEHRLELRAAGADGGALARRVLTAARSRDGAIIGVADTMLVLMIPGQIVVNPIPAVDNSARCQSENIYTASLDVQYALSPFSGE
jgi:hypothetical protein